MKSIIFPVGWLSLIVTVAFSNGLHAAGYPERPIRLAVGYTTGSSTDIVARAIAVKLADALGQPVVVENRPGASANIAANMVAKAAPDGYTLLLTANSLATSPSLYRKLTYNAVEDLAPITQLTSAPHVLVVNAALPVNSVKELIAYVKARPGQINFASSGTGSPDQMASELLKYMAGIDMLHVPYKGAPPAMNDVIAGRVAVYFPSLSTGLPFVKAGQVKALAVSSLKRSAVLPDIPTVAEAALPGFEVAVWYGIFAPAGTPRDIVQKLNGAINLVLMSPEIQQLFMTLGTTRVGSTPGELAAFVKSEIEKWANVIKTIGLAID